MYWCCKHRKKKNLKFLVRSVSFSSPVGATADVALMHWCGELSSHSSHSSQTCKACRTSPVTLSMLNRNETEKYSFQDGGRMKKLFCGAGAGGVVVKLP
jgi:hypothetical protein